VLCGATVEDKDEFRIGSDWFTAYDDVTSGNTAQNHHITWDATEGTFPNPFGTPRSYHAPTYDPGAPGIRQVTITCSADDHGAPNYWDDQALGVATRTINVWQVTIVKEQSDEISQNNDMEGASGEEPYVQNKPAMGGATLGWVEWHNPADCIWYMGNTELKGPIPTAVPRVDGFLWKQEKSGWTMCKSPGGIWDYVEQPFSGIDDSPSAEWQDCDSRHPNIGGADVNEVFMYDGPGFCGGEGNNNHINQGWRGFKHEKTYLTWLTWGEGSDNKVEVSNRLEWQVEFELGVTDPPNQKWTVVGSHTP